MGRSEKRALESNLRVILTHFLKWKYQPHRVPVVGADRSLNIASGFAKPFKIVLALRITCQKSFLKLTKMRSKLRIGKPILNQQFSLSLVNGHFNKSWMKSIGLIRASIWSTIASPIGIVRFDLQKLPDRGCKGERRSACCGEGAIGLWLLRTILLRRLYANGVREERGRSGRRERGRSHSQQSISLFVPAVFH